MSYIQSVASEQTWLLPYSIDELVEENNPVRVIRAYVYSLPMEELGFVRAVPAGTGRPGYDPRELLECVSKFILTEIMQVIYECRQGKQSPGTCVPACRSEWRRDETL